MAKTTGSAAVAERGDDHRVGLGRMYTVIDGDRYLISEAEHLIEDGEHVLRSRDTGIVAQAEDFWDALRQLTEKLEDLMEHLRELLEQEQATDSDRELFALLAERFLPVYQAVAQKQERELRQPIRLRVFPLHRRRGTHPESDWRPISHASSSSAASHA